MIKERIIIQKEIPEAAIPAGSNPDRLERYGWLVRPMGSVSMGLLLLRLVLGSVFIAHGAQKVFGWWGGPGLEGTVNMMSSMGLPAFMGYGLALTELVGGVMLVLGLLTRFASLGIFAVMLGAVMLVHLKAGFFAPQGYEFPMTLGVIALSLFITGPGRFSIDALASAHRQPRMVKGPVKVRERDTITTRRSI